MNDLSRRRVLGTAGVLTGVAALGLSAVTPTAAAAPLHTDGTATTWRGPRSANSWRILDRTEIHPIEGSGRSVRLASGEAATLLLHVARRFHYEIDQLRADDVTGHRTSRTVRRPHESNYLSGTAIAIRPYAYPLGARGGLYPHELVVVRDILTELDGAVAWGGDFDVPQESHFEVALGPTHPKVRGVARKLRAWRDTPGRGAGTVDAFEPERRESVEAFGRRSGQSPARKPAQAREPGQGVSVPDRRTPR
ncbi:hypothetical protein M4914_01815 [Streptomyces somaliensis DSM 40738]|uniref:hypothetical protein n=1 Tax=Streptomyces somaliensis TaxID=78355 RepID=UPI0021C4C73B|nr:hypothetical protein [Streptomyces somaliensis]MCQ0021829.1 hypothetical protein [Streptomyces somaliensis DSM 40738]